MNWKSFCKTISVILLVAVLALSLTACGKAELYTSSESEVPLYIGGIDYDADTLTATVHLTLSETDRKTDAEAVRKYDYSKKNYWYNTVTNVYVLDGAATFSAVRSALTQDDTNRDGTVYSRLQIVFDYVTIYKSTQSAVGGIKNGKNYVHGFAVAESGSTEATLTRDTPYTAAWYSTLIICAVILGLVAVGITLKFGGNYGGRKENQERREG